MKHLGWLAGSALAIMAPAAATAQIAFPTKAVTATIATTRPNLSDATVSLNSVTGVTATDAGTRAIEIYPLDNLTGVTGGSTGVATLTPPVVETRYDPDYDVFYPVVTATAGAGGAGSGSITIRQTFATDPTPYSYGPLHYYADGRYYTDPDIDYLPKFTNTNLPSLEVYLPIGASDLLDQGGSYTAELTIPGDYSTTAGLDSGAGQHYLALINPTWRITSNFLYDASTNLTTFRAEKSNYDLGNEGPAGLRLDVFFFGANAGAVPEPSTWAGMTAGLLLLGSALRRRRAAAGVGAPAAGS